jgi:hypothetical protein
VGPLKENQISPELKAVIKMVDEVVKPLLAIRESLENTQGDFAAVQKELATFAYQLTALYDCFDKNSQATAARNTDLQELAKHFKQSFKQLEKVDEHIRWGIRSAASDLRDAAREELKMGIQSEVEPAVRDLRNAVNQNLEQLNTYQRMTWVMHAKIIGIAIVCGLAVGVTSFFCLTHKIGQLYCDCECIVKQETPVESIKPPTIEKSQPKPKETAESARSLRRR